MTADAVPTATPMHPLPEDILAAAIATLPRPEQGARLTADERMDIAEAAVTRARLLDQASNAGVHHHELFDGTCRRRWVLSAFIRHCAETRHDRGDVVLFDADDQDRDRGRQGESRTAVDW